jgi:hypothetical protein
MLFADYRPRLIIWQEMEPWDGAVRNQV